MRKITTVVGATLISGLLLAALAPAATTTVWKATLNAKQEVPAQVVANAAGKGTFKGTMKGKTLKWKLTFSKLTGPATAAHIHLGAKGKAGNVLIPLCAPCKSPVSGSAKLTAAEITAFKKHLLYANVHTAKNPNGEIRGQISKG